MHFLRDRLGDAGLAEDAAQEAFLAAAMSLENLDRPESFRGWLYRIAYRKGAVMRTRRDRQPKPMPLTGPAGPEPVSKKEAPASHEPTIMERLRRAISRMKGEDRALLDLRFVDEFSFAEIAEITGGTDTGVRSRIWRLKKGLLEWLDGQDSETA